MLWMMSAFAVDGHPTMLAPSAAPLQDHVAQVDVRAVGFGLAAVGFARFGHGQLVTASVQPIDRLVLNVVAGRSESRCPREGECGVLVHYDAMLRAQIAAVSRRRFRLAAVLGGGTGLQAGIAVWAALPNDRIEFDFGWGATARTQALFPGRNPKRWSQVDEVSRFAWHGLFSQFESGVTLHVGKQDLFHFRVGMASYMPVGTFRIDPELGKVELGIELTVGTSMFFGSMASITTSAAF